MSTAGRLCSALTQDALPGSMWDRFQMERSIESIALATERYATDENVALDEAAEGLRRARSLLIAKRRADLGLIATLTTAAILLFVISAASSWRLRRWIRRALGRRWIFVLGECQYLARVLSHDGVVRIALRRNGDAGSSLQEMTATTASVAIPALRGQIEAGAAVRIEADQAAFAQPWTFVLSDRWSTGEKAVVGGQVCLLGETVNRPSVGASRLTYHGLYCTQGIGDLPALPSVSREIDDAAIILRRWGAVANTYTRDATKLNLAEALLTSDIVHLAAHATPSAVLLSDGWLGREIWDEIDRDRVRCGLLILSGCDAARLEDDAALLWELVTAGVNVIAPLRRVHDYVGRVFICELLHAMLPKPRARGIPISECVRVAATRCKYRWSGFGTHNLKWTEVVDSFILFGDPSLTLVQR
ncbi:MAG: CHAT domain-containing protein [Clostridia bacterium]|nr:CHAT domain-containing protein [Deltaproteobacteria bacterium]